MPLNPGENRVTRRGPDGVLLQWSNSQERPSGAGWLQASKASFPRVRTYLWYRPASSMDTDRANAETRKAQEEAIPPLQRLAQMVGRPMSYMRKAYQEYVDRAGLPRFQPNKRVVFGGQPYYVVSGVSDVDQTMKIKNPVSGEVKTVNAREVTDAAPTDKQYAVGDKVILAKGSLDPNKEQEATVLGYDALRGTYKVSLNAKSAEHAKAEEGRIDIHTVYPEAIDAFVPDSFRVTTLPEEVLRGYDERLIVETLHRARKSGRTSVQMQEVISDLQAHGKPISQGTIQYVIAQLTRVNPHLQYNSNSGGIYLGAAGKTLEDVMRSRSITPESGGFGSKNLTQDSETDVYTHVGQRVQTNSGLGIIKGILGNIATVITGRGNDRKAFNVPLDQIKDEFNRKLHIDPAAPKYVGNVRNKDAFWIIRDREGVQRMKVGDTVTLLPGVTDVKTKDPVAGKVLSVNDDGTVDMRAKIGKQEHTFRVFNRQVRGVPQLKDVRALQDWLFMHRALTLGSSVKVGNTELSFGNSRDKHINLAFEDGEDYSNNEHVWFTPQDAGLATRGWEYVIQGLGSLWGDDTNFAQSLAPSKQLLSVINEVYPGAKFITIARDTTTAPDAIKSVKNKINFKVTVDKEVIGKRFVLDRLYEQYEESSAKASIPATMVGENNAIRITTDGTSMFLSLGKLFKEEPGNAPPIRTDAADLEQMGKKRREEVLAKADKAPTFHDVVRATMLSKSRSWETDPGAEFIRDSSVFTYDPIHDRYTVGLEHYDAAHRFLKQFFGDRAYSSNILETINRGYYAYAPDKLIGDLAAKYQKEVREKRAVKDGPVATAPIEIEGFNQGISGKKLRPYQNAAVRFVLDNTSTLLAMDQGTGKSVTAIAGVVEKLNRLNELDPSKKHKALVVAPASVAQTSWMKDLDASLTKRDAKGNVFPSKYKYTLLMGADRTEAYKALADNTDNTAIAVTSYNTFSMQDWMEIRDLGFDVVVIDEAQALSGAKDAGIITQRLQAVLDNVVHKVALTGTPLENDPEDLQAILAWLKPELFGDAAKFKNDFVDMDYVSTIDAAGRPVARKRGVRLKNLPVLQSRIDQIMFRVEKEDLVEKYGKGDDAHAISSRKDHAAKYESVVKRYLDPAITPEAKARLGELSVVPGKVIFPLFQKSPKDGTEEPFKRHPDGRITLNFDAGYNPITMTAYPEYKAMQDRAKAAMREKYKYILETTGRPPNMNQFLTEMQQCLNDPSILARKYPGKGFETPVRNPKVDRMLNIVANHFSDGKFKGSGDHGKIIIFAEHVETLKFLEQQLTHQFPQLAGRVIKFVGTGHVGMENAAGIKERKDIENAFNKDPHFKYPIMLASNAAKTGVNLYAANAVINYDIGWNPQDINQRIDRAHRIRSLKDVATSKTAPARDVYAHNLVVTDESGDIRSSIEARKLFTHKVKERMFDVMIRGKEEEGTVDLPEDDFQKLGEELLFDAEVKPSRDPGVDYKRTREQARDRKSIERKQRELERLYGGFARYRRDYPK